MKVHVVRSNVSCVSVVFDDGYRGYVCGFAFAGIRGLHRAHGDHADTLACVYVYTCGDAEPCVRIHLPYASRTAIAYTCSPPYVRVCVCLIVMRCLRCVHVYVRASDSVFEIHVCHCVCVSLSLSAYVWNVSAVVCICGIYVYIYIYWGVE